MKQVAFERNVKKLATKKPLGMPQNRINEDKIEEEFSLQRSKAVRAFEHDFPRPQGIFASWFYFDMEMLHKDIKNKYCTEKKKSALLEK